MREGTHTRAKVKSHSIILMLFLSEAMALIWAIVFVAATGINLANSDKAFYFLLGLPWILAHTCVAAILIGLLVFVAFYSCAAMKPLGKSLAITTALVSGELLILVPFNPKYGVIGGAVAFLGAMVLVALLPDLNSRVGRDSPRH